MEENEAKYAQTEFSLSKLYCMIHVFGCHLPVTLYWISDATDIGFPNWAHSKMTPKLLSSSNHRKPAEEGSCSQFVSTVYRCLASVVISRTSDTVWQNPAGRNLHKQRDNKDCIGSCTSAGLVPWAGAKARWWIFSKYGTSLVKLKPCVTGSFGLMREEPGGDGDVPQEEEETGRGG